MCVLTDGALDHPLRGAAVPRGLGAVRAHSILPLPPQVGGAVGLLRGGAWGHMAGAPHLATAPLGGDRKRVV